MYKNIAIQLWSTQEDVSKGLLDVIKRMKDAGANGVELYAIPDIPAEEFAATLDEMGMKIASSHLGFDTLTKDLDATLAYFKPLGTKTLVCPGYHPADFADMKRFAEEFSAAARKAKEHGVELLYHNHSNEFTQLFDGVPYWIRLAEEYPDIGLQLDCFWAYNADFDPLELLNKYPTRIKSLHLKNGFKGPDFTDLDNGAINFEPLIKRAEELGIEWSILECEKSCEYTYTFCKNSVDYIKGLDK